MDQTPLRRPPLHLHIYQGRPGIWCARAELHTGHGPVILTAEAPATLVRDFVRAELGSPQIGQEYFGAYDEIGGPFDFIKKAASAAQSFVANNVVNQAVSVAKQMLPAQAVKIADTVAKATGVVPQPSQLISAFDLGAKALMGDARAKGAIRDLASKAASGIPGAKVAFSVLSTTAKLLPAVRQIPGAGVAMNMVPGLGQGLAAFDVAQNLWNGNPAGAALAAAGFIPGGAMFQQAAQMAQQAGPLAQLAAPLLGQGGGFPGLPAAPPGFPPMLGYPGAPAGFPAQAPQFGPLGWPGQAYFPRFPGKG